MGDGMNTLVLCADQLSPFALGYAGCDWVRTPAIDRLARSGTVFTDAACTSPICVPARASLMTGRYVHQLGNWDNGHAYSGREAPSWGRMITDAGGRVTTIGKLHFESEEAPTGFDDQIVPMHAEQGAGDTFSLLRDDLPARPELRTMVTEACAGDSSYTRYDELVATETAAWLRRRATDEEPWTAFVSLVSPHHPLIAPEEFAALYDAASIPLPVQWRTAEQPDHPALGRLRRFYGLDGEFTEQEVRNARATYLALVSYLDHQIGRILDELAATGLDTRTRVIFTSDHGDNVGDHGLWWKNCMYAGAVGVPLVLNGPDIAAGKTCETPVSHVDLVPTILEYAGVAPSPDLPGRSLTAIASEPTDPTRAVFAEYHATGSSAGMFMVADGEYRYIEYIDEPPQLFDRRRDPYELNDLGADPAYADVRAAYATKLRDICDPAAVDARAKADQRATIDRLGGPDAVRARGYRTHVPVPEGPTTEALNRAGVSGDFLV